MANKILVFIEQRNGKIKKSSLEAVRTASEIAAKNTFTIEAVVIGNEVENPTALGGYGAKKVTYFKNATLENYSTSAYTDITVNYAKEIDADILIFANTSLGKDLAPHVAVKLDAGIATDVVAIDFKDNDLILTRPVYAGKALIDLKVTSAKKVLTLRPNIFNAGTPSDQIAELNVVSVDNPNLASKVIEVKKSEGKLDVAEADIIVSGGRGMKGPEHFKLIEDLAEQLGAATGASRAVVDAGWRPHAEQVGQTGKTVSPNLYIALGISGAIQHLAGMRSSKYIVAINKDKDAPIFQVADYGIVGDVFEIVPALIEEIKKIKS